MKKKPHLLPLSVLALAIIAFLAFKKQKQIPPKAKQPNIVFIFSDDHAYQAIGAYGNPYVQTPHIDRIAAEGAIFNNFLVTNSICGPSRASLITGKYSHKNGYKTNERRFDVSQQLFSRLLKQGDYQTAWVGKWHLGNLPGDAFDYWNILPGQGHYYNPDFINDHNDTIRIEGYVTDIITDLATGWLTNRDKDKPFFLVVGEKATHREWLPDIQDLGAYDHIDFPLPETFYDNYEGREAAAAQDMTIDKTMRLQEDLKVHVQYDYTEEELKRRKEEIIKTYYSSEKPTPEQERNIENYLRNGIYSRFNEEQKKAFAGYYDNVSKEFDAKKLSGRELVEWKYQRYLKDYLATANSLDRNIGKILAYLEQNGLAENTIVIYGSDQGFYLGEHGWFDKRFIYEESLRTPFVIRYPGVIKPGTRIDQQLLNIDWAPTLLDIAGVPIPNDIQGESFRNILETNGKAPGIRKASYYHYYEFPQPHHVYPHFGIRTDRYKLVRFYGEKSSWELFDLENDPKEVANLYGKPGYDKLIADLKKELKELILHYEDTEAETIFNDSAS